MGDPTQTIESARVVVACRRKWLRIAWNRNAGGRLIRKVDEVSVGVDGK